MAKQLCKMVEHTLTLEFGGKLLCCSADFGPRLPVTATKKIDDFPQSQIPTLEHTTSKSTNPSPRADGTPCRMPAIITKMNAKFPPKRCEVPRADIVGVQERGGHFVSEKIWRRQVLPQLLRRFCIGKCESWTQGTRDVPRSDAASHVVPHFHSADSGVVFKNGQLAPTFAHIIWH